LANNIDFLVKCVRHPGFAHEQPTTEFFSHHMTGILESLVPQTLSSLNPHLLFGLTTFVESFKPRNTLSSNWDGTSSEFHSWRAAGPVRQKFSLELGQEKLDISTQISGSSFSFTPLGDKKDAENASKSISLLSTDLITSRYSDQNMKCTVWNSKMEIDGKLYSGTVTVQTPPKENTISIDVWLNGQTGENSTHYKFLVQSPLANAASKGVALNPVVMSPMPGKIVKVHAQDGAKIKKGDPILILEAMKMEHVVSAPCDG
jgi:acetyl/propionyl-CoA carboxylase alpha subunit